MPESYREVPAESTVEVAAQGAMSVELWEALATKLAGAEVLSSKIADATSSPPSSVACTAAFTEESPADEAASSAEYADDAVVASEPASGEAPPLPRLSGAGLRGRRKGRRLVQREAETRQPL